MCAAALLSACGGDDGGDDSGADTNGSSGPADSGTDPTLDPTDDSADDPTVEPDSSGDGPGTTTDDPTMPTTDPDTSSGGPTGDPVAFRFNSISVRDPHFFAPLVGDATENNVNVPLNTALNTDGEDGDPPPDGFLDLGLVVILRPLDQSDGGGADFNFANAQCTAPTETSSCDLFPATELYTATYTNNVAGPCLEPNPAELSDYDAQPGPPEATPGPCFESSPASVILQTMTFSLPLSEAVVSATYVGEPAGNLVTGNIQGFLTTADAESTEVEVPILGVMPIADLLREEDKDGDGWRMHVAFTAEVVDWTGG